MWSNENFFYTFRTNAEACLSGVRSNRAGKCEQTVAAMITETRQAIQFSLSLTRLLGFNPPYSIDRTLVSRERREKSGELPQRSQITFILEREDHNNFIDVIIIMWCFYVVIFLSSRWNFFWLVENDINDWAGKRHTTQIFDDSANVLSRDCRTYNIYFKTSLLLASALIDTTLGRCRRSLVEHVFCDTNNEAKHDNLFTCVAGMEGEQR